MLTRVRELGWKLPTPGSRLDGALLSMAIEFRCGSTKTIPPSHGGEALVLHLLEEGYNGTLSKEALAFVNSEMASDRLKAHIQRSQLHQSLSNTPAPSRPRMRL